MDQTFPCSACGAPNEPETGQTRMACTYCGAHLTIPDEMRTQAKPRVEKISPKPRPTPSLETEAPDLLRQAQPIAVKAWNAYAYWTWLRWLLPACFTILIVGVILCAVLGMLPFLISSFR
ncbi:MAG: hypothetical protein JNK32_09915 [Anaerolineales bacterium]|nr:hypothetical protein [Anaerolineales bacterium]